MLSDELLKIICCPACHGDLRYDRTQETLACTRCRKVYHVKNDIPVLIDEPSIPRPSVGVDSAQRR